METATVRKSTVTISFDWANSLLPKLFSNTVTTISYAFSPVINKILRPALAKICTAIWNTTCLSHHCHHCQNHHPPPHCAHVHYLISINIQQALMNVGTFVCVCVCVWRNSVPHFCFTHTHTTSDCPFAATCHTSRKIPWDIGGKVQFSNAIPPIHGWMWANFIK